MTFYGETINSSEFFLFQGSRLFEWELSLNVFCILHDK